jgi:hypothetical protein
MAARTGASSILEASRKICRMVGLYGTSGFQALTEDEVFTAAVAALAAACQAFEALDDYPGQIDRTAPIGAGDEGGV